MSHGDDIFVALQRILPKHLLSRLIAKLAESRHTRLKNTLIGAAIKYFDINIQEASSESLDDYENFNAFFTRQLKPGARPIDSTDTGIISPVDGAISQAGVIRETKILQAKGIDYSLSALIGDRDGGKLFENGAFATIYLSPRDYHRVHLPVAGQLLRTRYIPGALFSVNKQTTQALPGLFARNERLVCEFTSQQLGQFTVIFVGAMLVAGIETVWDGFENPNPGSVREIDHCARKLNFAKGDEIGRFKFGSTVILLFQNQAVALDNGLAPSTVVRMGEKIASSQII